MEHICLHILVYYWYILKWVHYNWVVTSYLLGIPVILHIDREDIAWIVLFRINCVPVRLEIWFAIEVIHKFVIVVDFNVHFGVRLILVLVTSFRDHVRVIRLHWDIYGAVFLRSCKFKLTLRTFGLPKWGFVVIYIIPNSFIALVAFIPSLSKSWKTSFEVPVVDKKDTSFAVIIIVQGVNSIRNLLPVMVSPAFGVSRVKLGL